MKSKLRVGILLNDYMIPAWSYKMFEQINRSYYAEIVLIVKNDSFRDDRQKTLIERVLVNFRIIIYLIYFKFDKRIYTPEHDAFRLKNIKDIFNSNIIRVIPKKTKYRDIIIDEDIARIEQENIDVLIRGGFRILSGGILNVAKYGLWSFHHADNAVNRGGPPGIWEMLEDSQETGVTLQICSEDLDNGRILFKTFSRTINTSLILNKNNFYWKALSFIPNKLRELYELGENEFISNVDRLNNDPIFYSNHLYQQKNLGNTKMLFFIVKKLYRDIVNIISKIFYLKQWILLFKISESSSISKTFYRFEKIIPPRDRFWADPFVKEKHGKFYIFIEELIYNANKGHISVLTMDDKGNVSEPVRVLERSYHLSYPFLIEHHGIMYMIPETKQNRTIELYKCIEFPYKWEFERTLIKDIEAVDTTVIERDNKYWLFTNIAVNRGASNLEELYIFSSDTLLSDKWIPHVKNPVVSDIKNSRPAGKFFVYNNNLYRPSQNNTVRYGYGMKINKVLSLTELDYVEEEVSSILPNWDTELVATHTLNHDGKLTVIDGLLKRRRNVLQILKFILMKVRLRIGWLISGD